MSCDKNIDLPGDLKCRATSLECLQHTTWTYDMLLHYCYVKTMICHFLNIAVICRFLVQLGNNVPQYVHCEGICHGELLKF